MAALSHPSSSPWAEGSVTGIDAGIILIFASARYRDILPFYAVPRFNSRTLLEFACLALIFIIVLSAYFAFLENIGVPITPPVSTYQKLHWPIWVMFLLISVMPAIFEEMAFRGVIQSALEPVLGEREALLIQAALFSILHLSPMIFPSHFIMGLCFGYLRLRTRSLYPSMLLHASWNAFVLYEALY